jgi:hypothetical protein
LVDDECVCPSRSDIPFGAAEVTFARDGTASAKDKDGDKFGYCAHHNDLLLYPDPYLANGIPYDFAGLSVHYKFVRQLENQSAKGP